MTRGLPRRARLTSPREFQTVFATGARVDRSGLGIVWRVSSGAARIGFAVSRRVGGAVARNRVRRRLRAAYRDVCQVHPPGVDVIVVGTPRSAGAAFPALCAALARGLTDIPEARKRF